MTSSPADLPRRGHGRRLSGLGVAEVTSCVLMYPVASMDKPFSAPQGRAMAQGFFPFVYVLGSLLLMLPPASWRWSCC